MRRFILAFITFLLLCAAPPVAQANSIQSINITVDIQPDGSALITDQRIFTAEEGTEHFISLGDLGESEIEDFTVSEMGTPLTNVGDWNVDASLEEKAGKYGIHETSDGVELCWGIRKLGPRNTRSPILCVSFPTAPRPSTGSSSTGTWTR